MLAPRNQVSPGLQAMLLAFGGEHSRLRPIERNFPFNQENRSDSFDPQADLRTAMETFNRSPWGGAAVSPQPQISYEQPAYQPAQTQQFVPAQHQPAPMAAPVPVQQPTLQYMPQQNFDDLDIGSYIGETSSSSSPSQESAVLVNFKTALNPISVQLEKSLRIQGATFKLLKEMLDVMKAQQKPVTPNHPVARQVPMNPYVNRIPVNNGPVEEIPIMDDFSESDGDEMEQTEAILRQFQGQQEEYNPEDDEEVPVAPAKPAQRKVRVTAKRNKQ